MPRFLKYLFTTMLFFALSAGAYAYDFCEDGLYYKVESKSYKTCQITCQNRNRNDYRGHVVVPSIVTHDGVEYIVVGVDGHAFDNSLELLSVRFPATINRVERAFSNCPNLRHVTFEGTSPPVVSKGALEGMKVYVPNEALESYAITRNCMGVNFLPLYYNIRFVIDDEEISNATIRIGDKIAVPEVAPRRGHKFSGWDGLPADTLMVGHDLVIDGSFSAKIFRINFVVEGDTIQSRRMRYGATIEYPKVSADGPYEFAGWTHRPKGGKMPAKKVTVEGRYRLNAPKAVRMAEIPSDTILCYAITHAVQASSRAKKGSAEVRNGHRLPYLPVGQECWNRPDEVEMMQLGSEGWYRRVLDYNNKCEVYYIPDDSVKLKARYVISNFPTTMLHRGPVAFRSKRDEVLRVFRFHADGHTLTDRSTLKPVDVNSLEYVIEHQFHDAAGHTKYAYAFVGWVDGTTAFYHRQGAFPLNLEHVCLQSDAPLFDDKGKLLNDALFDVAYYNRKVFLVPADNALYMFSSDDDDKVFEKFDILQPE